MTRNFLGYEPKDRHGRVLTDYDIELSGDSGISFIRVRDGKVTDMSRHYGLRAKTAAQELRDRNADMPPTKTVFIVMLMVVVIIVGAYSL